MADDDGIAFLFISFLFFSFASILRLHEVGFQVRHKLNEHNVLTLISNQSLDKKEKMMGVL